MGVFRILARLANETKWNTVTLENRFLLCLLWYKQNSVDEKKKSKI